MKLKINGKISGATRKLNWGLGEGAPCVRRIRKGLPEMVTFQWRCEEGAAGEDVGESIPQRGRTKA